MIPKEYKRVFILLFFAILFSLWIYINYSYTTGGVYIAIAVVALVIYNYAPKILGGK